MRRRNAIPRNERQALARERALAALAVMRRKGLPITKAASESATTPKTVQRYVGTALIRSGRRGKYRPTPSDRLARTLNVITPTGTRAATIRGSRIASRIAEHANAVKNYLNFKDGSGLTKYEGKSFNASGERFQFVTDLGTLDSLADAEDLKIEQLYLATHGTAA
jgi:hypothetical protein